MERKRKKKESNKKKERGQYDTGEKEMKMRQKMERKCWWVKMKQFI